METHRFRIGGHLCEIAFCNEGDGVDLISSFAPFAVEDGGDLLFRLAVDKDFRWDLRGDEVGQFDCGGNNFGVYRMADGSYQFEICNERKVLCALMEANPDFSNCVVVLTGEDKPARDFGLNNALIVGIRFCFGTAVHPADACFGGAQRRDRLSVLGQERYGEKHSHAFVAEIYSWFGFDERRQSRSEG